MQKSDVIRTIIFLPQTHKAGNKSMYSLVKESGYFQLHNEITKEDIYKVLIDYPDCAGEWISLSEDKRTSSGWFLQDNNYGKYIVGYYPYKLNTNIQYSDKIAACSDYIKKELEAIRSS